MDFLNTEQGRNIAIYDVVSNISPTVEIQFHSSWTISNKHGGSQLSNDTDTTSDIVHRREGGGWTASERSVIHIWTDLHNRTIKTEH